MTRPAGGWQYPREDYPTGGSVPNGGTTGQTLTKLSNTDQDTGWVTPSGGGGGGGALTFLALVTLSAGAAATFTSVISATYDDYLLVWEGAFPGTNATLFGIQLSSDNGATWVTTAYRYGTAQYGLSTNFSNYLNGSGQAALAISPGTAGNALKSYGVTELFEANTSAPKRIVTKGVSCAGDGNIYTHHTGADHATAQTFNAIRVVPSAGVLTGVFRLYGRQKS